jgi:hypothetical protein
MGYSTAAVDEAGQTGFKFEQGSTRLFAVTIVLTNDVQDIRDRLARFRRERGWSDATEFKFHSTPRLHKAQLLEQIATWPLVARVLVVDKLQLPVAFQRLKSLEFYAWCVAELLDRLPVGELGHTTLWLDEFGPSKLTLQLIRENLHRRALWGEKPHLFRRMTFRRSRSEGLIQVADLMGGAVYRWLTSGDDSYYRLLTRNTLVWKYHPLKTNPLT